MRRTPPRLQTRRNANRRLGGGRRSSKGPSPRLTVLPGTLFVKPSPGTDPRTRSGFEDGRMGIPPRDGGSSLAHDPRPARRAGRAAPSVAVLARARRRSRPRPPRTSSWRPGKSARTRWSTRSTGRAEGVTLVASVTPRWVRVVVHDTGSWHGRNVQRRGRGLGLWLARALMDRISIRRDLPGTKVVMWRFLGGPA